MRPWNRVNRTSAIAASVPSTTARVAETTPIRSDSQAASSNCSFCTSSRYHTVDAPPQAPASGDELNEVAIITRIGM